MLNRLILSTIVLMFLPSATLAMDNPLPAKYDSRIKYVNYNEDQVTRVVGTFHISTQIAFSRQEKIVDVALGDSAAWQVITTKNFIFLKPRENGRRSNMQVISEKPNGDLHSYQFELNSREGGIGDGDDEVFFKVKFRYPAEARKRKIENQQALRKKNTQRKIAANLSKPKSTRLKKKHTKKRRKVKTHRKYLKNGRNYNYGAQGDKFLYPSLVYDDGRRTFMKFDRLNGMPAIFRLNKDGSEGTLNLHVKDDLITINKVDLRFIVRMNKGIASVFSLIGYDKYPRFKSKTVSSRVVRRVKK